MPFVKPRAPFFSGSRHHSPEDEPIQIDDERARALVAAGLVEIVVEIPAEDEPNTAEDEAEDEPNTAEDEPNTAEDPAPSQAERATARNHRKRK